VSGRRAPIVLLTDFGTRDTYVGQMKLVIAGIAPEAPVIDLSHGVSPQDVAEGAWLLDVAMPYLPEGSVVVAVVDPGVGTARAGLVLRSGTRLLVGPDNGLLSVGLPPALRRAAARGGSRVELEEGWAWRVENRSLMLPAPSATFHGRDVFAPVAAQLWRGVPPEEVGPPAREVVVLPPFLAEAAPDGTLRGEVIHVDRFGNLVTTVHGSQVGRDATVLVGDARIEGLSRTFADVSPGELLAHVDSSGFLEVACREGSAAERLGLGRGAPVTVIP